MSSDDRFEEAVIKDNMFHRRLSDLRNSSLTEEHLTAIEELNRPAERTIFSEPEPVKTRLTLEDVERIAFFDDSSPTYNFRYLMRKLERESHDRHLKRLQSGTPQSIDTSDLHLEVVRALKEINSLLASVAYPLLTESGDLLESRLAKVA